MKISRKLKITAAALAVAMAVSAMPASIGMMASASAPAATQSAKAAISQKLVEQNLGTRAQNNSYSYIDSSVVNNFSGNFAATTWLPNPTDIQEFSMGITYNAQDTRNNGFGNGVSAYFSEHITELSVTELAFTDESGTVTYFTRQMSSNYYFDYIGRQITLLGDGSFRLDDGGIGSNYRTFRADGKLSYVYRNTFHGWKAYMTYNADNTIAQVDIISMDNRTGNSFRYEYYTAPGAATPRVSKITSGNTAKTVYTFGYDASGNLTNIISGSDVDVSLQYTNGLMTKYVNNVTRNNTNVTYSAIDGLNRVSRMNKTDLSGSILKDIQFAYANSQTVVIEDGGMSIISFDENGMVL